MGIIELTDDGSHTIFLPEINEHYHSVKGAIQESMHVYIEAGLSQCNKKNIHVLEFGFGTGLNAFLTCMEAQKYNLSVTFTSLEKYPLSQDITEKLNYARNFPEKDGQLFKDLHACEWNESIELTPSFTLQKNEIDFRDFDFPGHYDLVYYDAFAPDKQAEVWSQSIFDKLFESVNEHGILTTYCAKGNIRRMLLQAGFTVERIPGPPGKRQMLRAVKL